MTPLSMRRMQRRTSELVRGLYESMLILTAGLLMQWNQWHVVRIVNAKRLLDELPDESAFSWSTIFFTGGLLLTLAQYRPQWIKRRGAVFRNMLMLFELFAMLFIADYVLLSIWQPFLNIFDQVLHTVGHSKWACPRFNFHLCPGLSAWLINDAFAFIRLVVSLSLFLLAIEVASPRWRLAIEFLLLGQLPEINALPRKRRIRHLSKRPPIQN